MALSVVKYGSEVLRKKSQFVPVVTDEMVNLAKDMLSTMHATKGVGLAAQQIGRLESVCVIEIPEGCEDDDETEEFNASAVEMPLVMFNPKIISTSGEQEGKEGCLSFPSIGGEVTRPYEVVVQFMDISGAVRMITVRGFLARAVMHETDHLQGVLYIDHMSEEGRKKVEHKLLKLAKKNGGVL